jgi:hypothetical protein
VKGLETKTRIRPDLQIVYPGRHVLTDVAVVHSLGTRGRENPANSTATAKKMAQEKRRKYAAVANRHDAELIPFVVETCGGLGPDAIALLDVISGAAAEHLSLWSQEDAAKEAELSGHRGAEGQCHDYPERSRRCSRTSGVKASVIRGRC